MVSPRMQQHCSKSNISTLLARSLTHMLNILQLNSPMQLSLRVQTLNVKKDIWICAQVTAGPGCVIDTQLKTFDLSHGQAVW